MHEKMWQAIREIIMKKNSRSNPGPTFKRSVIIVINFPLSFTIFITLISLVNLSSLYSLPSRANLTSEFILAAFMITSKGTMATISNKNHPVTYYMAIFLRQSTI